MAVACEKGRCHDFKLLENSKTYFHPNTQALLDSGYQGQQKRQKNTKLPHKKKKKQKLSKQQKAENKALSQKRILAENIIRKFKILRILKHDSRNRRKRFSLRVNLIAAIHNIEIQMRS